MSRPVADEAAARAFVAERVEWFRTHALDLEGVPTNLLNPQESEKRASATTALWLLEGEFPWEYAWQQARAGNALFYEALCLIAANELEGKYQTLDPLRGYVIDVLRDPPTIKKGRRRESYYFRDICIAHLVQDVCDRFGLRATEATKKGTEKGRSACAVVADAMGMKYGAVRKVWDKSGRKSRA